MDSKTDKCIKIIEDHFKNTPKIIININIADCGGIIGLSESGLHKLLNERNTFIRKAVEIIGKDKADEIYDAIEDYEMTDEDYTRESKRITCENGGCEHNSMDKDTEMGDILYCNKYLRGQKNRCKDRYYLI
jgi:hypothetical protein